MATLRKPRLLGLALPGGGTQGAFSWGVLDALLEDGRFELDAISAVGAGAVNAVLLSSALQGGREAARASLTRFWRAVAFDHSEDAPVFPPSRLNEDSFAEVLVPFDGETVHPLARLRDLLLRTVDFNALGKSSVRVLVSSTNIGSGSGRLRVFDSHRVSMTPESLVASVCTPFTSHPVQIDGSAYWGDGLGGNPPLFPLIYEAVSADILLLQLPPAHQGSQPNTAQEIFERVNDLALSASLAAELRSIEFVQGLVSKGQLDPRQYKPLLMHFIDGTAAIAKVAGVGSASRERADPDHLQALFLAGRAAASDWLSTHGDSVGRRSTMDVRGYISSLEV